MTKDQIDAIPRRTVRELFDEVDPECRYANQLIAVFESAVNLEWWRGYYAGRASGQSGDGNG